MLANTEKEDLNFVVINIKYRRFKVFVKCFVLPQIDVLSD